MYISKFQVLNYKSFRQTQAVSLTRGINIVTGQNNAGKTALLQALSLAWNFDPHRSITMVPSSTTPILDPSKIVVAVTLSREEFLSAMVGSQVFVPLPTGSTSYPDVPYLHNHNPTSLDSFRKWFFSLDSFTFHLSREVAEDGVARWVPASIPSFGLYASDNAPLYVPCEVTRSLETKLLQMSLSNRPPSDEVGAAVGHQLGTLVYRFEAERFNMGVSPFGANRILSPRATNLPEVLGTLQGNNVAFDKFNEDVREILPQIGRVTVVPFDTMQRILVWSPIANREARIDLAPGLNESGTGIGQVLAMVYLVLTSKTPQVILIDEPQSFLHPGAVRKLIEMLKGNPLHQYIIATHSPTIITAAQPDTIMLVTHDGNESHLQRLDATDAGHLRRYLDEIGASLADVFGADGIVWVEGITEEKCYPLIVEKIIKRSLMGRVIKAVIATGDFERKNAERYFEVYTRLSGAASLIPPAVAFMFDDEGRTEAEKTDLCKRGQDRVWFTKRRMYENYLLDARAIAAVLNSTNGHAKLVEEADVQAYIDKCLADPKYFKPMETSRGIDWMRADVLLHDLFWNVAGLDYRKTTHSVELTEWFMENDPSKLTDISEMLREVLALK